MLGGDAYVDLRTVLGYLRAMFPDRMRLSLDGRYAITGESARLDGGGEPAKAFDLRVLPDGTATVRAYSFAWGQALRMNPYRSGYDQDRPEREIAEMVEHTVAESVAHLVDYRSLRRSVDRIDRAAEAAPSRPAEWRVEVSQPWSTVYRCSGCGSRRATSPGAPAPTGCPTCQSRTAAIVDAARTALDEQTARVRVAAPYDWDGWR
ncbi:hypothetical protein [Zavarzinia sp.]|jgi:DNA-directed RNA polymerase subunit RPC12/RpoP|uniref:hypothetical protein n=1 Tax=Zavarzinia sp. TaxID=2027920 RepID=UPI00356189F8